MGRAFSPVYYATRVRACIRTYWKRVKETSGGDQRRYKRKIIK